MLYKIAIGLEDEKKYNIVPLGAAKSIGIYDCQTKKLKVTNITTICEERLEFIFENATAIYHPIPTICPTIKERAEQKGVAIKTGKWKTLEDLIKNLTHLDDLN